MENVGQIQINITGSKGNLELSPDNYDIREIISVLENVEDLLVPFEKKERPIISYKIEGGSVTHVFKTSIQYIVGLNAVIAQISQMNSIDFLDLATARAIENFQDLAKKHDYRFTIKTSMPNSNQLLINRHTSYTRSESIWADAEFYFYGKLTNAGGKDKANIHLYTEDLGTLRVQIPISFLEQYSDNLLYKTFGVRASGKQHSETGEIDTSSLKFIELVNYQPKYDEAYLNGLIDRASANWSHVGDKNNWLEQIRGNYEM
ncbi:hypothetical protein [Dyadobacter crusticola]|uniref:hypothetical protein n=1 Tax=Dyadobacter crusticola TaxID=292407 RepID=UPI0004E1F10D|nr:hypothetical protein [Dyadobacter crusticola]